MENWNQYYFEEFPNLILSYCAQRIPAHHCEHCRAPQNRRCLVNHGELRREPFMFRFAWYGVTLLDQGLFTHFPDCYEGWVANTGGYPLPVKKTGLGCVQVMPPHELISPRDPFPEWATYVAFWLGEIGIHLEQMTGVQPGAFFRALETDNSFCLEGHRHKYENHLLQNAMGKFNA